jgi:hypothetical protein
MPILIPVFLKKLRKIPQDHIQTLISLTIIITTIIMVTILIIKNPNKKQTTPPWIRLIMISL